MIRTYFRRILYRVILLRISQRETREKRYRGINLKLVGRVGRDTEFTDWRNYQSTSFEYAKIKEKKKKNTDAKHERAVVLRAIIASLPCVDELSSCCTWARV